MFIWIVESLVYGDVHLFNENAIGGNSVSLVDINNISDHQFLDWDGYSVAISSSVNSNFLGVNLLFELEILSLLDPVADTCNEAGEDKTSINSERLNKCSLVGAKARYD